MSKQQLYYDDVQVGDALPPLVKHPTTRQLVQYAGASGDYYEIHYDHHFAVKSGLKDGVIVHGLLTAGWLAQLMTDWLPSPLALKKFGRELSFHGAPRRHHHLHGHDRQQVRKRWPALGRLRHCGREPTG